jgi:hypothetical protein
MSRVDAISSVQAHGPEMSVPPGVDPPGLSLAQVLRPAWRQMAVFGAVGVLVALILLVALPRPHAGAVERIDQGPVIARAQKLGTLPVFIPTPLPSGWVPDSVNLDAGVGREHLHLGYQAPDFGVVGLEETTARKWRTLLSQVTAGAKPTEYLTINGQRWVRMESSRRTLQSLVWYGPRNEVVIVAGTSSLTNLESLAGSLRIS